MIRDNIKKETVSKYIPEKDRLILQENTLITVSYYFLMMVLLILKIWGYVLNQY